MVKISDRIKIQKQKNRKKKLEKKSFEASLESNQN
jgi:hypothetical protein